jgi:hypothetical protein
MMSFLIDYIYVLRKLFRPVMHHFCLDHVAHDQISLTIN